MAEKPATDLEALIAAGPQFAAASAKHPLGVPSDYVAQREWDHSIPSESIRSDMSRIAAAGRTVSQPARYFDGDEWKPASLSPAKVAELQRQMAQAGLFGPKGKYRNGVWDKDSAAAYAEVLAYANASGMDKDTALKRYQAAPADPGAGREPLVKRLTNPDDLRATFETVARTKLGRKLAPGEVDRFVQAYQAQEGGAQEAAYNADATGGSVTDAPNPQAFLAARIAKEYGAESQAHDIADQFGAFGALLNEVGG